MRPHAQNFQKKKNFQNKSDRSIHIIFELFLFTQYKKKLEYKPRCYTLTKEKTKQKSNSPTKKGDTLMSIKNVQTSGHELTKQKKKKKKSSIKFLLSGNEHKFKNLLRPHILILILKKINFLFLD